MVQYTVSPSELDVMRQCPLRHQLLYGERWTKSIDDELHPLPFGTLWHSVLEAHYRAIQQHQKAAHVSRGDWRRFDHAAAEQHACERVIEVLDRVQNEKARETLTWMYDGHLNKWGVDPEWQIMAIEHAAEVELPGPPGLKVDMTFRMKMKMDLIVKQRGRIVIVDNKSCKNLPSNLELDLDDQFGLYIWGGRQMGLKVFGAIHNAARKVRLKDDESGKKTTPLDERFLRTPLARGDKELTRIATEAWQISYERYRGLQEIVEMKRLGIDVEAPRHPSPMSCSWKCDFVEACIAGRKGVKIRDYISNKGYDQDRSRH